MILTEQAQSGVNAVLNDTKKRLTEIIGKPVSVIYRIKVNDISPDHIIQTVCRVCNTTWSRILDKTRQREVTVPRQLIAWMMYNYCGLTHRMIALKFGNDDHTFSVHMVERVNDMIATNDELYMQPLRIVESCILKLTDGQ